MAMFNSDVSLPEGISLKKSHVRLGAFSSSRSCWSWKWRQRVARWKTNGAAKGTPQTFHVLMARQLEVLGGCTMAAKAVKCRRLDERMMKMISGWWLIYPSEKYESQWEGLSHNGKTKMFETTNYASGMTYEIVQW